ncbi:ABC transporter substrate-binding protein [Peptoniphilus catoniae]|uniref:ABC transporter substrate-binding protein n=1 Tax=Peptoniphilus catoniae TaxID=1660341 RepID=UPI0010FEF131|nr:ABC transporter substrate-binding protein [Peptoniphilus catoniae]
MKKILVLLVMIGLLTACGKNSKEVSENTKENADSANTQVSEESKDQGEKKKIGIIKYIDHVSLDAAKEGFVEELEKQGLDVEIEEVSANGDMNLITTLAQKLEGDHVDLVYAISTPSAQGAKNVIHDIPVVFSAVTDPVGAGLVESFENPGGNITGVSDYIDPGQQIDEFLKVYPDVKTFGVLYSTSEQNSQVQVEELGKALEERGLKLEKTGITNVNDIPQAIAVLSGKIDALFAITDNMVANAAPIVSENLLKNKIPSLSSEEGQVKEGLLMSEGVNYKEQGAQAARLALKILNGEDVKTIPVEYNEVNDKLVNGKTAEALGVDLNNEMFKDADIIK